MRIDSTPLTILSSFQITLKRKYFLSPFIVLLFALTVLPACSEKTEVNANNMNTFSLNSKTVSNNDVLKITLPEKHPSKLSIITPNKQIFIVYSEEDQIALIPYQSLKIAKTIDLPVSSLEGVTWVNGKKSKQIVFKQPGIYKVYMADNLETEPENTFHFTQDIELK